MKAYEVASEEAGDRIDTDGLFEIANLFPGTTGLPMTVWVSPRGNSRHDIRVKVNMTHGNQMNPSNTAVVGMRPSPHIIAGSLSPDDEKAVSQWISLNAPALLAYWDGEIDMAQLVKVLKVLTTSQAS
jgi:hypothetical protein